MLASALLGGTALLFAAGSASAVPCAGTCTYPSIGNDTLGPALIITLNPDGSGSIANGPGVAQGPYDGVEDTYIGLENNSGQAVGSVSLSGSGIFGFDYDGIGFYGAPTNAMDDPSQRYGGPLGYFNIVDNNNGTLFIIGSLADQAYTYFSLEEPLSATSFTVTGTAPGTTPIPAALPLFASGLGMLGWVARRRKKKAIASA